MSGMESAYLSRSLPRRLTDLRYRDSLVILDHTGKYVIAAFSSEPNWNHEELNVELMEAFKKANTHYRFAPDPNRRGEDVQAIPVGVSFGGGQQVRTGVMPVTLYAGAALTPVQVVGNLVYSCKENQATVADLVKVPAVKRIANFGNGKRAALLAR